LNKGSEASNHCDPATGRCAAAGFFGTVGVVVFVGVFVVFERSGVETAVFDEAGAWVGEPPPPPFIARNTAAEAITQQHSIAAAARTIAVPFDDILYAETTFFLTSSFLS
jgi:hypothetical protein